MDNKFKCTVDLEIDYKSQKIEGFGYDSRTAKLNDFLYNLDVNFKSWGIDSIHVGSPDQKISFNLDLNDEKTGESEVYEFDIDLVDIETDNQLENHKNLSCCIIPYTLEVNLFDLTRNANRISGKGKAKLLFS